MSKFGSFKGDYIDTKPHILGIINMLNEIQEMPDNDLIKRNIENVKKNLLLLI